MGIRFFVLGEEGCKYGKGKARIIPRVLDWN